MSDAKAYGRAVLHACVEQQGWKATEKEPEPPALVVEQARVLFREQESVFKRSALWGVDPQETARRMAAARWGITLDSSD